MTAKKEVRDIRLELWDGKKSIMVDQAGLPEADLEDLRYYIYDHLMEEEAYKSNELIDSYFEDFEIEVSYEVTYSHKGFPGTRECPPEEPEVEFELFWGKVYLPEYVYRLRIDDIYTEIVSEHFSYDCSDIEQDRW
jgi:hypothetical protein